ncbi:MAG TPA: ABC transporter ATP-binding protein [Acidimicrobiia bacterium]|nr:ABC transporter ATP-binding protein [Acidimicrobiia bacterium]
MSERTPVLEVEDIAVQFATSRSMFDGVRRRPVRVVRAVDGVSFTVAPGEVLAVVGESGCGKTTTANLILGLIPPTSGRVVVAGDDLAMLDKDAMRAKRRRLQMIFQDPYESLNPRMKVGDIVAEPLRVHKVPTDRADERHRVERALVQAGLSPPDVYWDRHPHQLSGGQRQRVVIAAALALEPQVLIADEPVSMLDVSIRAEILNLLARLASEQGIAVLMITHDLSTVAAYSHRVAVMYLGRVVEIGPTTEVLTSPRHPYTEALLSVVPVPDPARRTRPIVLVGETPDPSRIAPGCRFHPRCPRAFDQCPIVDPPLETVGTDHLAACLLNSR